MTETKKWWQSKAVIAGVGSVAILLLETFGVNVINEEALSELIGALAAYGEEVVVGGLNIFALWGRVVAKKQIA